MERRNFLKLFGGTVAGIALEQAIPLGRVWSFPKRITHCGIDYGLYPSRTVITRFYLEPAARDMAKEIDRIYLADYRKFSVGENIKIRLPQRYCGLPPATAPETQLKSPRTPTLPACGIPES